jgi:hypothetical protein
MTYRNGFTDVSPGGDTPVESSTESAPAQSFGATTFGDDIGPPSAGNFVSDTGGDSGLVLTLNSVDLNLDDVLARAVQVGTVLDGDCQPCGGHSSSALNAHVNLDVSPDASSLAIAPQSLCLPSLPVLSSLLGGSGYTGDHDDGACSTAGSTSACGCTTDGGGAQDAGVGQADLSINANLDVGHGTGGDALSLLLNGAGLVGDAGASDGLLSGAILTGSNAESDAGISVDAGSLPGIEGALDGLVASADLLHLSDCGCGST